MMMALALRQHVTQVRQWRVGREALEQIGLAVLTATMAALARQPHHIGRILSQGERTAAHQAACPGNGVGHQCGSGSNSAATAARGDQPRSAYISN
jgi:hypothetical protein